MAGDWIPMRCDLSDDPSVIAMSLALSLDEFAVVGRLHRLWSWANRHTTDGNAPCVSSEWVDRYVSTPGFAAAMLTAGWLRVRSGGIELPHFDRWNSQNAKQRALTARRVAAHKLKGNAPGNDAIVSDALPTGHNSTGNKNPPTPKGGEGAGKRPRKAKPRTEEHPLFAEFWGAYPRKEARTNAAKAFAKINPSPELFSLMMAALARQKRLPKWVKDEGEYIPHPATWLNGERWKDLPPEVRASTGGTSTPIDLLENIVPKDPAQ
jgi:hypothetical protein